MPSKGLGCVEGAKFKDLTVGDRNESVLAADVYFRSMISTMMVWHYNNLQGKLPNTYKRI